MGNTTAAVRRVIGMASATTLALGLVVLPAHAEAQGDSEACTPGFWKNHTDQWWEDETTGDLIPTTRTLGAAFTIPDEFAHLRDDTFLEALNYNRFRGREGTARKLLKHAVAALLNAAYDDADGHMLYPLTRSGDIKPAVEAALLGSEADMNAVKDWFDGIHNDLDCPL